MIRCGFLIVLLMWLTSVFGQTERIDSLRKLLPVVTKETEVDCLNLLAKEFYFYWVHSDSSLLYADLAYQKARSIHYTSGTAESLSLKAGVYGRLLGQPMLMVKYALEALELLKGSNDNKALSTAYYHLSVGYTLIGKHDLSLAASNESVKFAQLSFDKNVRGWSEQGAGFLYYKQGAYWKAFDHLIQAQEIGRQTNDSVLISLSLAIIARSFNRAGDPRQALNYYYEAMRFAPPFMRLWSHQEDMAAAHVQLKQYDSAKYYLELNRRDLEASTTDIKVRQKFAPFSWGNSVEVQLVSKDYKLLFNEVLPALPRLRASRDVFPYLQALEILGKIYLRQRHFQKAMYYAKELHEVARNVWNSEAKKNAAELLSSIYDATAHRDSAYYYYREFIQLRDSLQTAQYSAKTALYFAASEAANKIRLLQQETQLNQRELLLTKKEISEQAKLKRVLLAGMLLLLILFAVLFRNNILRRRNENLRNQQQHSLLQRKALELEMQALRAQMNPHFIFNCLSAIDNLIQTQQADKATTCLSRFARLIRNVLDSSKNNLVPFQKDYETMKLYLELEQFRCNNKFHYQLIVADELLQGDYKVPPLIVQPFIENAIHHGLLNKKEDSREVTIQARLELEEIVYYVTDNGIGRKQAAHLKSINRPYQQSYGIAITRERIQLHNKNKKEDGLLIRDLEDQGLCVGTEAVIRIHSSP